MTGLVQGADLVDNPSPALCLYSANEPSGNLEPRRLLAGTIYPNNNNQGVLLDTILRPAWDE